MIIVTVAVVRVLVTKVTQYIYIYIRTPFSSRQVRSTTDTSGTGTRKAIPVSFPLSAGMTLPTALAAPVDDGMMFVPAVRPPRQSLLDGPSTVFCVAVNACTVVIRASMMTKLSLMTLASGARQLVVHDALLYTFHSTHQSNVTIRPEYSRTVLYLKDVSWI